MRAPRPVAVDVLPLVVELATVLVGGLLEVGRVVVDDDDWRVEVDVPF